MTIQHPSDSNKFTPPPPFSDEDLAQAFLRFHAGRVRYVALWSRWFIWDDKRWVPDDILHIFHLSRSICRKAAASCTANENIARGMASAKTVYAVERLVKTERVVAAVTDQWDCDHWQLNTPAGVVDLRSGYLETPKPEYYITKTTAVGPGEGCPEWQRFLKRVTGNDQELEAYLQRSAGYTLTGSTREQSLEFFYGTGANGKSVFLNTLAGIMGDYHRTAPIETFTASNTDRHPTELAALRGARLVTSVETEEGRRWAESRIKMLTGGERISARYMRGDLFEYTPQLKLIIAGNHKPGLRNVDEAIRRRLHLVPFAVKIPEKERDPELMEKLKAEWPGILQWMIDGCIEWQRIGLAPPRAVRETTDAYLESEDAIASWISECCATEPAAWASSGDLYESWKGWAERSGEYVGSKKRLSQLLEPRGFHPSRKGGKRCFVGIQVRMITAQPERGNP